MDTERTDFDKAFEAINRPNTTTEIPEVLNGAPLGRNSYWFLSEAFGELDRRDVNLDLAVALEVFSRRITHHWYAKMADIFLEWNTLSNRQGRYNGEWITFDKEQLRATKQPIEGPVDGTIFTIETKAPHLEGKLEFFIDEGGELEEFMNPMKATGKLKSTPDGEVVDELTATFREGRIIKLERVEFRTDPKGEVPTIVKKSELDLWHVASFLVRPH